MSKEVVKEEHITTTTVENKTLYEDKDTENYEKILDKRDEINVFIGEGEKTFPIKKKTFMKIMEVMPKKKELAINYVTFSAVSTTEIEERTEMIRKQKSKAIEKEAFFKIKIPKSHPMKLTFKPEESEFDLFKEFFNVRENKKKLPPVNEDINVPEEEKQKEKELILKTKKDKPKKDKPTEEKKDKPKEDKKEEKKPEQKEEQKPEEKEEQKPGETKTTKLRGKKKDKKKDEHPKEENEKQQPKKEEPKKEEPQKEEIKEEHVEKEEEEPKTKLRGKKEKKNKNEDKKENKKEEDKKDKKEDKKREDEKKEKKEDKRKEEESNKGKNEKKPEYQLPVQYEEYSASTQVQFAHHWRTHPRTYGKDSRYCRVCRNTHGLIRKYGLNICRKCFRERSELLGFKCTK